MGRRFYISPILISYLKTRVTSAGGIKPERKQHNWNQITLNGLIKTRKTLKLSKQRSQTRLFDTAVENNP